MKPKKDEFLDILTELRARIKIAMKELTIVDNELHSMSFARTSALLIRYNKKTKKEKLEQEKKDKEKAEHYKEVRSKIKGL